MKKVKKSGSGVVKKFKSFYAVQLGFLSPVLEMRVASASSLEESESQNLEESEVSVTEDNSDDPITVTSERDVIHSKKVEKQKSKTSALETTLLTFLDCPPKPTPVEDEDKSFFDSLLPTLRTFDTDQKLEFRAEVLRILQRIRRSKSQSTQAFYAQCHAPTQSFHVPAGPPQHFTTLQTPPGNLYYQAQPAQFEKTQLQSHQRQNITTPTEHSTLISQNSFDSTTDTELSTFSDDTQLY